MIYEELFDEAEKEYYQSNRSHYVAYSLRQLDGMSMEELVSEKERLEQLKMRLVEDAPLVFDFDVQRALAEHFSEDMMAYDCKIRDIEDAYDLAMRERKESYARQIEDKELEKQKKLDDARKNSIGVILNEKHAKVLSYRDKLCDVVLRYNISPSDVKVSEDVTPEQMNDILDAALDGCKKLTSIKDSKLYDLIREGLSVQFFGWLLVCFICAPAIFVWMVVYMSISTSRIYKNIDKLKIAESLMYDLDFEEMFKPEIEGVIEEDSPIFEMYDDIEDKKAASLQELFANNPNSKIGEEQMSFIKCAEDIGGRVEYINNKANELYKETVSFIDEGLRMVQQCVDILIKDAKELGTYINPLPVLDTKFTLGLYKGTIEKKFDLGLSNISFHPSDGMTDFIKLLLCNMLLSVKEKYLSVTIYDPDNMGAAYNEFLQKDIVDYVDVKTDGYEAIITSLRQYAQENIKTLGKLDINTYNNNAASVGKITREYKLLIILSGWKKFDENSEFMRFLEFSAQYGVFVWAVCPQNIPKALRYNIPFEGIGDPYPVTNEVIERCIGFYMESVNNSKADALDYITKFADKYIPEKDYWTYNTDRGIGLNFGLESGDPEKGYEIMLGDGNVHALMVGATGAGKSAAINQILCNLLRKYSPKDLELVMVDFKNVEFATYTDKDTDLSRIPHAKIIAGTKDGEYAVSVFEYLLHEMNRRTEIFAKAGVKKLEDYNKQCRAAGEVDKCLPRIIVLIDEFQVMFTEVDAKIVEKINGYITSLSKLARFCGCHMFFTSQSMKGTMQKDVMDQFSLRAALRCSKEVSTTIIGSEDAGKIKTKFGYLYTNTSGGEDSSTTKIWRVPFASDKVLYDTMDLMSTLEESRGYHCERALFYNEKKQHFQEELLKLYEERDGLSSAPRVLFLGERTNFSLNDAPVNFNFTVDDGENLAIVAFEREDLLNMCMTIIDNVLAKKDAKLLINTADKDTGYLLDINKYLSEQVQEFSGPDFTYEDWIELLEDIIESRRETDTRELKPMFMLCILWEKCRGVGRETNYKLEERFKRILQEGPTVDLHFIFVDKIGKELPSFILNCCSHRIAAKTDENVAYKYVNTSSPTKFPASGFAIYSYGSTQSKFKIYQHSFTRELESRELVL